MSTHPLHHDIEWGVPLYNERQLFEFLILVFNSRRDAGGLKLVNYFLKNVIIVGPLLIISMQRLFSAIISRK